MDVGDGAEATMGVYAGRAVDELAINEAVTDDDGMRDALDSVAVVLAGFFVVVFFFDVVDFLVCVLLAK